MSTVPTTIAGRPPASDLLPEGFGDLWAERQRLYDLARAAVARSRELASADAAAAAEKADRATRVAAAQAGRPIPTKSPSVDKLAEQRLAADRTSEALLEAHRAAEEAVRLLLSAAVESGEVPAAHRRVELGNQIREHLDQLAQLLPQHAEASAGASWFLTPGRPANPMPQQVPVISLPGAESIGPSARDAFTNLPALIERVRSEFPETTDPTT